MKFLDKMQSFFETVYKHLAEIIFSIVFIILMCYILVPKISEVRGNGAASQCRSNMNLISFFLESELNNEYLEFDWSSVLYQKRSQRILDKIKEFSDSERLKKMDTSEYYFTVEDNIITLMCRKHEIEDPYTIEIPEKYRMSAAAPEKKTSEPAASLTVTGIRTYIKGEKIDPNNPEKTVFSPSDDLKPIFEDITVILHNLDGKETVLDKNSYKLSSEGFDMNVPGKKTIIVTYASDGDWNNTLKGFFSFEVMKNSQSPEFTVDFGEEKGKYVLAAWDWSDYVRDTMAGDSEEMSFDASIVYYGDEYLYYPDGFTINKLRDNNNPLISAADRDDSTYSAYFIKFDPNTIIDNPEEAKDIKDGAMMMNENGEIYIWQIEPSKEVDAGWLRVYCELTKKE